MIIKTKVDIRGATSENIPVKTNMIIDIIVLITKTAQSPIMLSVRDIWIKSFSRKPEIDYYGVADQ